MIYLNIKLFLKCPYIFDIYYHSLLQWADYIISVVLRKIQEITESLPESRHSKVFIHLEIIDLSSLWTKVKPYNQNLLKTPQPIFFGLIMKL